MVVGAVAAALGAYLFQLIGARALGEIGYAPISAVWTIQYLIVSVVLYPVETYVTHRSLLHGAGSRNEATTRIWSWIGATAVVVTAVTWLLREPLLHGLGDLAFVVGLVTLTFGAFMIVRGLLAGTERFKAYGLVTATESVGRAILAGAAMLIVTSTRALAWTMPFGALAAASLWLIVRRRPREPRAFDHTPTPFRAGRFLVLTTAANAILQLLLASGPLVLAFAGGTAADVSILFVTLMAARVPLMFFFSGLLSRLLPTFLHLASTDQGQALRRTAWWIAAGALAAAIAGALAAAAVGGPLLGLLFGSAFEPPSWMAAGVTAGVLLATGSMILNQVLVAQGSPARSLIGWVTALVAAGVGFAVIGGDPAERVVWAFVLAEVVALAGLVVAAAQRPAPTAGAVGSGNSEPST
jgi:O-antigen/teichoic acid export membrane protein